jgi:hypothetical protein
MSGVDNKRARSESVAASDSVQPAAVKTAKMAARLKLRLTSHNMVLVRARYDLLRARYDLLRARYDRLMSSL